MTAKIPAGALLFAALARRASKCPARAGG